MSGNSESKRRHLALRREDRDKNNDSILRYYSGDLDDSPKVIESDAVVDIATPPPKCSECNGSGSVKTLFSRWECSLCHGTCYDLSDPLAVIRWQKACMEWSKSKIRLLGNQLHMATTTESERTEKCVEKFYERTKRRD